MHKLFLKRHSTWLWNALLFLLLTAQNGQTQNTLETIRQRGELIIGTEAAYPPFEYLDHDQFKGFDVEVGNEIGKEIGVRVRWINMKWAGVFGALETGKFDLVMAGITITEDRKKERGFSRPYFLSGQAVTRRRGDQRINSAKDLTDKIVAVQKETTGQKAALKLNIPASSRHEFDTLQDSLLDLRNSKADAVIADLPALQDVLRKGYPELETVGGVFVSENLGVVARKDDLELLAVVNRALDKMLVDGRYARFYQQHLGEPLPLEALAGLYRVRNEGTPIPASLLQNAAQAGSSSTAAPARPPVASAFTLRGDVIREVLPDLLLGARTTLTVTLFTLLCGVPAGLLIALARQSGFVPLKALAMVYVEVVRGTPLLMQIYVIYFVLPAVHINLPALPSGIAALSLNAAAYISEIFRAGIESIDSGQMEAARALGMDYRTSMRWIILPQTLRRVLPPLTNEAVALLKDSSLVSVVAIGELMLYGTQHAITSGSTITVYFTVALLYLTMTLPLTWLVRRLEARWQPISRPRTSGRVRKSALTQGV